MVRQYENVTQRQNSELRRVKCGSNKLDGIDFVHVRALPFPFPFPRPRPRPRLAPFCFSGVLDGESGLDRVAGAERSSNGEQGREEVVEVVGGRCFALADWFADPLD